jgi:DNA helicase-2/ATP-dependent DNA helicase PcrA
MPPWRPASIEAQAGQDAVQLMSVHAAKGLFPHENALNEADGLEEERRLMYVAITRARRRLYLTHSQYRLLHGQPRYGLASRFLEEIPEALVQSLRPARTAYHAPAYGAPSRPAPVDSAAPSGKYPHRIGSRVKHPRYGEGVVSGYQGQGAETEVRVAFSGVGDKWFILEYARLAAC